MKGQRALYARVDSKLATAVHLAAVREGLTLADLVTAALRKMPAVRRELRGVTKPRPAAVKRKKR
jgi:hypothetical protein